MDRQSSLAIQAASDHSDHMLLFAALLLPLRVSVLLGSEGSLSGDDPSDGWGDEEEGGRRGLGTGSSCPPLPTCPAILGSSSGSEGEGGGVGFAELFRASKEYAAIEVRRRQKACVCRTA